mgnify:FL=1
MYLSTCLFFLFFSDRLEDLVKRQNTELEELRQRVNSSNTASTSGRGSLSPEETQGPTLNFPSSGRETSWCHKGTDPLFEWPERPSTCTRSTSPGLLSMTSHEDPRTDVANQELEKDNNEAFNESEVSQKSLSLKTFLNAVS